MKQAFSDISFRNESLVLIHKMNSIIDEYVAQGFVLTVRQLYYQLVARDIVPNTEKSYKRITGLVNDAKLAGYMDWEAIEDRTRSFIRRGHWTSPGEIVRACASSYHEDLWDNQLTRVYVIVEKEALVGVLDQTCRQHDVPLLAARGYPSGTVLYEFARDDLIPALEAGQAVTILHLGDHDPSGIDMSRDLEERIRLFSSTGWEEGSYDPEMLEFTRIGLNMDQIRKLKPPENPAKTTDSRFTEYRRRFGNSSWELDALSPTYMNRLVSDEIDRHIDDDKLTETLARIETRKQKLVEVAEAL